MQRELNALSLLSSINEYTDLSRGVRLIDDFLINTAAQSDRQYVTETMTFWDDTKLASLYTLQD